MEPKQILKEKLLEQKALKTFANSDAGEQLRDRLADNLAATVQNLAHYRIMSHAELMANCAKIEAVLEIATILNAAETRVKNLEEEIAEDTND
jgi:hypothetical protein